eukprot:GDKH01012885.1.p1 GENE.GDKH01012885.1~~GDKH01012885.1.p1  ORF type:complete len:217 (+),score=26.56 GDKH01012885.1:1-651(+)
MGRGVFLKSIKTDFGILFGFVSMQCCQRGAVETADSIDRKTPAADSEETQPQAQETPQGGTMTEEHKSPPEGMECLVCFDDISDENYVEYRTNAQSPWFAGKFCESCLGRLMDSQFEKYTSDLAKTTCAREQRALLARGPPINVWDPNAFPEAGQEEVFALWFSSDKAEHPAKLKGCLEGDERLKWWEDQKRFIIKDEKVEDEESVDPKKEEPMTE